MRFWLDFRRNFIIIDGFGKDYRVLFCEENDSEQRRQTSVSGSWETVLDGTGNSPGLSSAVSFCRFYCYGKYMLCARGKKKDFCCVLQRSSVVA